MIGDLEVWNLKSGVFIKFLSFLLIITLTIINLSPLNFGNPQGSHTFMINNGQENSSFNQYSWGGIGEQANGMYGWNLTIIENLNGDSYPDLVISTPWYDNSNIIDAGIIYIFYGTEEHNFESLNYTNADVSIRGDSLGNKFGWAICNAGDVNNDGMDDLLVGAPGALNGRGRAYIFHGGLIPSGNYFASDHAARILNGPTTGGYYGSAVTGIGDLDQDGFGDILIGSPGSNEAIITYGFSESIKIYPNIWDDDPMTPGVITFNKGVNNTDNDTNTWGRLKGDDGWDWIDGIKDTVDGVYGHHVTTPTHGTTIDIADCHGPWEIDGPDGDNLTRGNRSALEVIAGRTREVSNPYGPSGSGDPMTSAAWGIEFNITPEMMEYISNNCTIKVTFNYESWDNEKIFNPGTTAGTEELCTVRSRIWNSTGKYYLGNIIKNNERYIFYHYQEYGTPEWNTVTDSFEYDITEFIDTAGTYYWDFGSSFGYKDTVQNNNDPDEGISTYFDDVSMIITNDRHVRLLGSLGSGFGSAVASLGDIDGDSFPDVLIGAPVTETGYAVLLHGQKRFKPQESVSSAKIILMGKNVGDKFGYSLANVGDIDNDGTADVLVGAPGGNYAHLYYGKTLNKPLLVPDLWENEEEKATPQLEFDSGLKTIGNTPGLAGADDGWDVCDGLYGSSGTAGSSVMYNNANIPDSTNVAADDRLLIGIGAHFGNTAKPDSGAYGVEFTVTQDMINATKYGGDAVLSYDWRFENLELESDETIWLKTFLRDSSNNFALGQDLDSSASSNNKDQTNEIFWSTTPDDRFDVFIQKCSNCFSKEGSYYLDVGGKIRTWTSSGTNQEDGIFHFDNLYLRFNPPPDREYIGPISSRFGATIGHSDKLNNDLYGDIIIGAPDYDSQKGDNSGAIFGFLSTAGSDAGTGDMGNISVFKSEDAEFTAFGETAGDNFGWTLSASLDLDSDEFPEVITSSINYDDITNNIGRVYILSITKSPLVKLVYPVGGEVLTGNIVVNATVMDPDDNIDHTYGVRFLYSNNLNDWIQFGIDNTIPISSNYYTSTWDTVNLPDGANYYLKVTAHDAELNMGDDISLELTVDNPFPPTINILSPGSNETIWDEIELKAFAKDSDLDMIGGGINKSMGIYYYLSNDQTNWELMGVVKKDLISEKNVYSLSFNSNIYPDGDYWLRVNCTDLDGFEVSDIVQFKIDNPWREPSLVLISPSKTPYDELFGTVTVSAAAFDFDGDINSSGVTFYISKDSQPYKWKRIGNAQDYTVNQTGEHIYSIDWDTSSVDDGWYLLRAFVNDSTGMTNESIGLPFIIHYLENNPPTIQLFSPKAGSVMETTQVIIARVRDLEDNIDPNGVSFYYSIDKLKWNRLGNTQVPSMIRVDSYDDYDFFWATDTFSDGEYYLNVSVSDTNGAISWDNQVEPVIIHNLNMNAPIIRILSPSKGQYINGEFILQVYAYDLEKNIDNKGVTFSISSNKVDWVTLDSVTKPLTNTRVYEYIWNTTEFEDGKYWFKGEVKDTDGLSSYAISEHFFLHNTLNNPPSVEYLGPHSGVLNGTVKINASIFDLENNIDPRGAYFEYSTDKNTWILIGNDPSGRLVDDSYIYEFYWDTKTVQDNWYWLRVRIQDLTSLEGLDLSDNLVMVHNSNNNPPIVTFVEPKKDLKLERIQSIVVEVIDFENDIDSVSFFYTSNNKTWNLIDTRYRPDKDNFYKTVWNTENVKNGLYYLKVIAKDKMGNQVEPIEGPFEVDLGKQTTEKISDNTIFWITVIIIIIIILIAIFSFILSYRSKRRDKELMDNVEIEMQETNIRNNDGDIVEPQGTVTIPEPQEDSTEISELDQAYISSGKVHDDIQDIKPELEEPELKLVLPKTLKIGAEEDISQVPDIELPSTEDIEE